MEEILKQIKDVLGVFTSIAAIITPILVLLWKYGINLLLANNIEILFEDLKTKLLRKIIDEVGLFFIIITSILSFLSNLRIYNISYNVVFAMCFALAIFTFLLIISYEDISRIKLNWFKNLVTWVKLKRRILNLLCALLSYIWFLTTFISFAASIKPILDGKYESTLDLYVELFTKYSTLSIPLTLMSLLLYGMFRFLIKTPFREFILLGQSKYKISFIYENEEFNDFFVLRVNNNKVFVCKEDTLYSDLTVYIIDKDKMSRVGVKYSRNRLA
ncbi:MAG TPA: hypothetical protein VEF53_06780 [Patescibacteria group bacterium]|nr:hypothetical protein [Patescibacteria group bacterium]